MPQPDDMNAAERAAQRERVLAGGGTHVLEEHLGRNRAERRKLAKKLAKRKARMKVKR
jgi:hypothetical protein